MTVAILVSVGVARDRCRIDNGMPYRFKLGEPFGTGVRRVLRVQIGIAEARLGKAGEGAQAIHDARKCFKRMRALLRLVRTGIGETAFDRENAAIRDLAARLSGVRDRDVLLQTIAALDDAGDAGLTSVTSLMRTAVQNADHATRPARTAQKATQLVLADLKTLRKRLHLLRMTPDTFETLERGLRRTQKRARRAMAEALEQGSDQAFHDWRKCVQQHWRHMQLLSRAWPDYFEARIATAKALSQLLGDDHDLAMLAAFASDRKRSGLNRAQSRMVAAACGLRRSELRRQAMGLAQRLHADTPKSLARHVRRLWSAAAETARVDAGAANSKRRRRSAPAA